MIYFLKKEKPSKTYRSIKEDLDTYCTLDGGTSVAAIGNIVRNKIPEGPFTRKREAKPRGTQREYSSKPLKYSIVKRILIFKR